MALCQVAEQGGVHAAARHLGRSHSAVSHAVLRLQELVGAELLEVRGRRSVPTEVGEIVVRQARRLLASARELEFLCETLTQGWEPELHIAFDVVLSHSYIGAILNRFAPKSRGTRVRLERHAVSGAAAAANDRGFDLVFTASLPAGVSPNPITTVSMVAVAGRAHSLVSEARVMSEADLARELQIVIGDTSENAPDARWLRAERRWTVPDFEVARELLSRGEAFCIVPREMFLGEIERGDLVELAPERALLMQVHLIAPKGGNTGPCAQIFRDCVPPPQT